MPVPEEMLSGGPLRVAISNALSQVVVDYTGRGPEQSRTSIVDDMVVCRLHGTLNRAERKLSLTGKDDLVLEVRRNFQEAMRADLVDAVTRLTGRPVVAFMSANNLDPDIAVELFMLEPAASG
jgi:uncharacterized protein YbcI